MENIKIIVKGFFIGIANIIPGVSGGTLMISLGIFEKLINTISNFFVDIKNNLKFLALLGLGALISIIVMSGAVTYALDNFRLPTILFFIGLIIGGIPMLSTKMKNNMKSITNILIFFVMFSIIIFMTFYDSGVNTVEFINMNALTYLSLFLVGIIAAASMVVPGISGSFMLIVLGFYEPILEAISNFFSFKDFLQNGIILTVFGLGVLIGIMLVAKAIKFLLSKFETKTYFGILGFVLASVISIIYSSFSEISEISFSLTHLIPGIFLFALGFLISFKLGD